MGTPAHFSGWGLNSVYGDSKAVPPPGRVNEGGSIGIPPPNMANRSFPDGSPTDFLSVGIDRQVQEVHDGRERGTGCPR